MIHFWTPSVILSDIQALDQFKYKKKKYKLDTIKFTIFISEAPVIVKGQNCIIAN